MKPAKRPQSCQGCPRNDRGVGFVRPSGDPGAKYIVIGQGPDIDCATQSKAFFEKSYTGSVMTDRIYKAGLQRSDVIFTDLVWCAMRDAYPPFRAPTEPLVTAVRHCWKAHLGPYLESLPATDRPRHIITVGDPPLRWFKGLKYSGKDRPPAVPHLGTTELHELPETK